MVITEATVISWLSANFPSVAIGLTAAITYVVIYSRLRAFLDRIETTEKELIKQARELSRLKTRLSRVILTHCQRHSDDMASLMKTEDEEKDND